MWPSIVLFVGLLLNLPTATAEVFATKFMNWNESGALEEPANKAYYLGVIRGLAWMNTYLENTGGQPAYCMPEGAEFQEQPIAIIKEFFEKNPQKLKDNPPTELALLLALITDYPCD
jgi:hypothetical protein